MNSNFIDQISALEKIPRKEQIEKDIVLHQILADLSREKNFVDNFLFKGGTCLIKGYLGYYRFSEDLDFTWKRQGEFVGKTSGQTIRYLEEVLKQTGRILERIAAKRDLDFKWDKSDRRYVELTNRGRITTFHIHYNGIVLKKDVDLKVQVNFMDELCMEQQNKSLQSLIGGKHRDLKGVFDEYDEYSSEIHFGLYDVKEILSEKIRALLTRRGIKARDFLDVYLISKNFGVNPEAMEECVIKKINFALEHYERFRNNFAEKKKLVKKGNVFEWGAEEELLIAEIDKKEFNGFIDRFTEYLQELVKKFNA